MWEIKQELSDYELLVHYNPYYIKEKIDSSYDYIDTMYDYHYPHQVGDLITHTIYFESVHIETLAISIIEYKEGLQKYIERTNTNLKVIEEVTKEYSQSDKDDVDLFFKTDGEYYPTHVIEKLKYDAYKLSNKLRAARLREREKAELLSKLETS
ncbi:hypothetical protein [Mammaliicoccus fleurettii]|uniref:hypothetical protein n=1 Tax=Mammaliicoccus fleurettii TaxID=150056 RepID=UPI001AADE9E0|nr:hypothetical protein [Mammaliicoccus fleurettii]MBO3062931.1 hypothetical protein [Mammaliicoccus fleurettii]